MNLCIYYWKVWLIAISMIYYQILENPQLGLKYCPFFKGQKLNWKPKVAVLTCNELWFIYFELSFVNDLLFCTYEFVGEAKLYFWFISTNFPIYLIEQYLSISYSNTIVSNTIHAICYKTTFHLKSKLIQTNFNKLNKLSSFILVDY